MSVIPDAILAELRARYAEPGRAYHAWPHIAGMLSRAASLAPSDPVAFELAILFHDAVYDPRARDNEAQSAALMRRLLAGHFDAALLDRAETLILATETHRLPVTEDAALVADAALFLDLDLAILASDAAAFAEYDAAIRREYAHVPEADYRAGRRAVLQTFLTRERIFFSDALGPEAEAVARDNLRRAIDALG
ncbi:hypothetical protein BKE38_12705 [Pseudoroseomonas deserti]|uniref:Phosphohydrolase n=1 Tax=Teichococcus deserti TaxID=1817963 RepID=A0A1V2H295_9PROT|nr:hypothetical protein [Pseudoroseomonas deserti]ONG53238.1 hypothetical protein BKE38_12705 [Pseudoroseomonas deserti]